MSNFDLMLIDEVRKYRNLYDPTHEDYKDMLKSKNHWEAIAEMLNHSEDVPYVKSKWRSLRDGYARARRRMLSGRWTRKAPQYKYFKELEFLDDFIKHKDEAGNFPSFKRERRGPVERDLPFEILDQELSSTGDLLVPDVILKEDQLGSGLDEVISSSSLPNDLRRDSTSLSPEALDNSLFFQPNLKEDPKDPFLEELFPGVLEPLKSLLLRAQQNLREEDAFGLFVAASLKKLSEASKTEATLHIQKILHDLQLKELCAKNCPEAQKIA